MLESFSVFSAILNGVLKVLMCNSTLSLHTLRQSTFTAWCYLLHNHTRAQAPVPLVLWFSPLCFEVHPLVAKVSFLFVYFHFKIHSFCLLFPLLSFILKRIKNLRKLHK